jgi:hypothetical protein
MAPSSETSDYEDKWTALFVEWANGKIAEWRMCLEDERLVLPESVKIAADIGYLERAIARITGEST